MQTKENKCLLGFWEVLLIIILLSILWKPIVAGITLLDCLYGSNNKNGNYRETLFGGETEFYFDNKLIASHKGNFEEFGFVYNNDENKTYSHTIYSFKIFVKDENGTTKQAFREYTCDFKNGCEFEDKVVER